MSNEILFGVHPVSEWLESAASRFIEIVVSGAPSGRVAEIIKRAQAQNIPVRQVSNSALRQLSGGRNPKGIAAFVHPYAYADLQAIIETGGAPLLLVVDGVTDPGNLGAIIRSASFFGATGIIVPRDRSAPINPVVERSAAGAVARLPICQANSLLRTLERLKERGFSIVVSVLGPHPLPSDVDMTGPTVLVVGSEGRGVRPSVRRIASSKVSLPSARTNSLNVSAFSAVLLYSAWSQRS